MGAKPCKAPSVLLVFLWHSKFCLGRGQPVKGKKGRGMEAPAFYIVFPEHPKSSTKSTLLGTFLV